MTSTSTLRMITELNPSEHLFCIYRTEEEHRALLTLFLRQGLEQGEKVLYIVDTRPITVILDYLRDDGLNVDSYLTGGQLNFYSAETLYLRDGQFDPDKMITLLRTETEQALDEGYSALRITDERTWVLRELPGFGQLTEYEARLNTFLPDSKCLALCQYDLRRFDPEVLLELLAIHPSVVIGLEVYDNYYYFPSIRFLGKDWSAVTFHHWLENLITRNVAETALKNEKAELECIVEERTAELTQINVQLRNEITKRTQAEESISEREEKYCTLFETARDAISITSPDCRFIDVNPAALELFDYTREELCQLDVQDTFSDPLEFIQFQKELEKQGTLENYPVTRRKKDGSVMSCLITSTVRWDENEEIISYQNITRDITPYKLAEEALQKSETTFRRTFEAIPDPAFLWERQADGRIILTRVNTAAYQATKEKVGKIIGGELTAVNNLIPHLGYNTNLMPNIEAILDTSETIRFETSIRVPDTEEAKWILIDIVKPAEDSILVIAKDITTRKQAEIALAQAKDHLTVQVAEKTRNLLLEKNRVETIIETIPEGILVLEVDGRMSLANKTIKESYWKIYHEELPVGYNCLKREDNLFLKTVKQLFLSKKGSSITIEPISELHLRFFSAVTRIHSERPFGAIIEVQDISPFIHFDSMRKRFVSMVSHELRTPISAIVQSTNNIEKYKERLSTAQTDQLLDIIARNAKLMTQLIEDLLLTSKLDEQRLTIEWKIYQPFKTLKIVLNQLELLRKSKAITIQVDVDENIELFGDPKQIGQIFRIFLDNALKYSNEKTTVQITAIDHYQGKYNPDGRDGVLIHFHDSGRGIREKDLPYLFDRFFRSEDVQQIPGTGLGLPIAQELTSLHQGEIFVESMFRKGATFFVFLPRLAKPPKNFDLNGQ